MGSHKGCRHIGSLSERKIATATLNSEGLGWICLSCFKETDNKNNFSKHGRTKNHPLAWVCPEGRIFCVQCSSFVEVDELPAKGQTLHDECVLAVKNLLNKPRQKSVELFETTLFTGDIESAKSEVDEEHNNQSLISAKPPGLHNLGNTCFLNSALQCLAAVNHLKLADEEQKPLTGALFDLLSTMRDSEASSAVSVNSSVKTKSKRSSKKSHGSAIDPAHFFNELSKKYEFFERNEQQDSHDFIRLLFNALDDEHKENKGEGEPIHRRVFGGVTAIQIGCKRCKGNSRKKEFSLDLSLAVDANPGLESSLENLSLKEGKTRLKDLLSSWNAPESLEDDDEFACESCYKKYSTNDGLKIDEDKKVIYSPATCQYFVDQLPTCLIIHLQRFSISRGGRLRRGAFGYGKDHRHIHIPKRLDMMPFTSSGKDSTSDSEYELVGMVLHEGSSPEYGHYISVVKRDQRWYRISDSSVSPISEDGAIASACSAYIIFYNRIV